MLTEDALGLGDRVRLAFEHDELVVVWCRVPRASLAAAREVSRSGSAWLDALIRLKPGRSSRSATTGFAAIAAHRSRPVGVDVEAVLDAEAAAELANHVLRTEERLERSPTGLTAAWTRKEAVLKAFGVGLAVEPAAIGSGAETQAWQSIACGPLGWAMLRSLRSPPGVKIAVALQGREPVKLTCFEVTPEEITLRQ